VADASAFVKYLLREDGWDRIAFYVRGMKPIYSVDHAVKEVGNALWKHSMRKIIDSDTAIKLFQAFLRLIETGVIILEPELKFIQQALEIALREGITLYDALYISQAQRLGALMITCDKKQAGIATRLGVQTHLIL